MTNNGAVSSTLNCGGSYTIPAGYHNGSGVITANDLAEQTIATATASVLTKGYTAWVNGVKITGTRTAVSTLQSGTLDMSTTSKNTVSKTVYFSPEFDTVPTVQVVENVNPSKYDTSVTSVTRQYCVITAKNTSSGNWSLTVTWTATV